MSKQQLIESIRSYNPSAEVEFLDAFDESALHRYLRHLRCRTGPRGPESIWVRPGDSPAIVGRNRARRAARLRRQEQQVG